MTMIKTPVYLSIGKSSYNSGPVRVTGAQTSAPGTSMPQGVMGYIKLDVEFDEDIFSRIVDTKTTVVVTAPAVPAKKATKVEAKAVVADLKQIGDEMDHLTNKD